MNAEQVLEQIAPMCNLKVKQVEHSPRTRVMVSGDSIALRTGGGKTYDFLPPAAGELAKVAGYSPAMKDKLSSKTFSAMATELLGQRKHYGLILRDNAVAGITTADTKGAVDPVRAIASMEKAITTFDCSRVLTPDSGTLRFEVVGPRQENVVKGDIVRGGAIVQFSPIGITIPTVESFVLRLVCLNGATAHEVQSSYQFGGNDGNIYNWMTKHTRSAYNSVGKIVGQWQKMRERKIPKGDRAAVLEQLIRNAHLSLEAANAVRASAVNEPPETEYDMLNILTWASSHVLTIPKQIMAAQYTASEYSSESSHRKNCPVCHRAS